jgi:predicted ATPase
MAIEKIHIQNYKSLVDVTIEKPNPFTVFVGPNASGKSNIFEALEFFLSQFKFDVKRVFQLFGGQESFMSRKNLDNDLSIEFRIDDENYRITNPVRNGTLFNLFETNFPQDKTVSNDDKLIRKQFFINFIKYFLGNTESVRFRDILNSDYKLIPDGSNLELILKRLLKEKVAKEELIDWLGLLIPGFSNFEINYNSLKGVNELYIYEKNNPKPFPKKMVSSGTINTISLLTAILQFNEPQFICIEEPENGIHPEAIKELVYFFKEQCEEKGHYIWLTTHSQSLVSALKPEEIIVVDKIEGETKVKQFQGEEFYSLSMDDAWLSNVLGGGVI